MKFLSDEEYKDIFKQYHLSDEDIWEIKHRTCLTADSIANFDEESEKEMDKFRSLVNMDKNMCKNIIEKCPGVLSNLVYRTSLNVRFLDDFDVFKEECRSAKEESKAKDYVFLECVYKEGNEALPINASYEKIFENTAGNDIIIFAKSSYNNKEISVDVDCYIYVPTSRKDVLAA